MAPSPHDGGPVSNPDQYVTCQSLEGNESRGIWTYNHSF